jgi:riboflavin biosynthesis pyrimidine reductase
VLDFFETVAFLVRRGALDAEVVWHTFYEWIDGRATEGVLRQARDEHPREWEDFGALRAKVDAIEASRGEADDPGGAARLPGGRGEAEIARAYTSRFRSTSKPAARSFGRGRRAWAPPT